MFKQPKVLPPGLAKELDLIDDIPDVETYRAPYHTRSGEPDGFDGLTAFWEIVDADAKPIAHVFCRDAASAMVRMLNKQATAQAIDSDNAAGRVRVHVLLPEH